MSGLARTNKIPTARLSLIYNETKRARRDRASPQRRSEKTRFAYRRSCLNAACLARSATMLHASNLIYIYIYIYISITKLLDELASWRSRGRAAGSKSMALSTKRPGSPWLARSGVDWLDLAALCASGRPARSIRRPAGSIRLLEKRGPVQRNVDFAAQGQCFVDVGLVASIWLLCALLCALAALIWVPCVLLDALAALICLPCALLGALAGSIWLPCALLCALGVSLWLLCALLGALAGSIWPWLARFGCPARSRAPWLARFWRNCAQAGLIWLLCSLLAALAGYRSPKTFSFSPVCLDAACLDAACIVRSGTFPHASNLVILYRRTDDQSQ